MVCLREGDHMADLSRRRKTKTPCNACKQRRDVRAAAATANVDANSDGANAVLGFVVSIFPEKNWRAWLVPINSNEKRAALAQYLESERPNHRLMTASGYSSTSSLLSLPAPTFAPTPTAARILASISCAISGFSFRNLRVLSLP